MIRAPAEHRIARWVLPAAAMLATILGTRVGSRPAIAGASLRLTDGRVLEGREVRQEGDVYLLVLENESVIPIPTALVSEVDLGGDEKGAAPNPPAVPPAPPGLTYAEPQTLAGIPVTPSTPKDQLAVFGEPAKFQPDIVKSNLGPSYWVMDPAQANWNPAKWVQPPIDPTWHPTSAFDPSKDALADSRATWPKSPIDSTWVPQDGFKKPDGAGVVAP